MEVAQRGTRPPVLGELPKKPLVSVLIGTRDRPAPVERCIKSVLAQGYENLEVLVLDDASPRYDMAAEVQERVHDARVECFRSDTQLGVAGGRNLLLQRSRGEIRVILDDDCVVKGTALFDRLVAHFRRWPHVGLVAFKIVDFAHQRARLLIPFSGRALKRQPDLADTLTPVSYYLGGAHAMRRAVTDTCGYYQPDLLYAAEELDLAYRMAHRDIHILYAPDLVVHHLPEGSVVDGSRGKQREIQYAARNKIWIAYKYLPFPYMPVYLGLWTSRNLVASVRERSLSHALLGLWAGVRGLRHQKRAPISSRAVRYLKSNHGRLWY